MKKYAMETAVGIFVVIGLFCVGYMTVKLGNVGLLGDDSYSLLARFTSVSHSLFFRLPMGFSRNRTLPSSGDSRPMMCLRSTLLPVPLLPMIVEIWPS